MSSVTRVNRPIASASRPQSNSHHSSSALRSTETLLQADRSVFTRTGRSVLQMGMWVSVEHGGITAQSIFQLSLLPSPLRAFFSPQHVKAVNQFSCRSKLPLVSSVTLITFPYTGNRPRSVSCRRDDVVLELAAVSG